MVVTIDGPAGAGKSSVAKELAERLGFAFLDTGAMYRAVTYAAMQSGVDLRDAEAVELVASKLKIRITKNAVYADDEDVSKSIRTQEVTRNIRFVANITNVRRVLNEKQRAMVQKDCFVTEGRDQGTEVFPDAACKIFLTASAEERARRRHKQLADSGKQIELKELLDQQNRRDQEDQSREVGRLVAAEDAITVFTDDMEQPQVVAHLEKLVRDRLDENHSERQ